FLRITLGCSSSARFTESVWAENGDLGRRWQWRLSPLHRAVCFPESYSTVMRLVTCWRPSCIGSCFPFSAGAAFSLQEPYRHFLCSTSGRGCLNRLFGCGTSARRAIFGAICYWY